MRDEGRIRGEGQLIRGQEHSLEVLANNEWYPVNSTIDMAHKIDAVTWWNDVGRYTGIKSPEVRRFMLDPNNYEFQPQHINRSEGGRLGTTETYLPPRPNQPLTRK